MAFAKIPEVQSATALMTQALSAGRKVQVKKRKADTPVSYLRKKEKERMRAISQYLAERLRTIPKTFPSIEELTPFYANLISLHTDENTYKKNMGRIQESIRLVHTLRKTYEGRIFAAQTEEKIKQSLRQFLGRVKSVLGKLDEVFSTFEQLRHHIINFPVVKLLPTVCIAGFPNVGKTTLLSQITGSKADIQNYAFTTKGLNLGYKSFGHLRVQFVDTPGTLHRDHMNTVEEYADVALTHLADLIIYVFDSLETYDLSLQKKLFTHVTSHGKTVLCYLSKTDIATPEQIEKVKNAVDVTFLNQEELEEEIRKTLKQS